MNCTRGKIAKIIQENTNAKENFIIRHLKSTLTFRDLNAREWEKSSGFGSKLAVIMFEKRVKEPNQIVMATVLILNLA